MSSRPGSRGLGHLNEVDDKAYCGYAKLSVRPSLTGLQALGTRTTFLNLSLHLILRRAGAPQCVVCDGMGYQMRATGLAEHVQNQGSSLKQREDGGGDKPTCTDHTNPSAG